MSRPILPDIPAEHPDESDEALPKYKGRKKGEPLLSEKTPSVSDEIEKAFSPDQARGPDGRWIAVVGAFIHARDEYQRAVEDHLNHANLKSVYDHGGTPSGGWTKKIESGEVSRHPTEEQVGEKNRIRRAKGDVFQEARKSLYKEAIAQSKAFEVRHHERLKSRPYEVVPKKHLEIEDGSTRAGYGLGAEAFYRENGASLRLGRHSTRERAQKVVDKVHAMEAKRLGISS